MKKFKTRFSFPVLSIFIIVLFVGVGLLMKNVFSWFNFSYIWPIILIAIGLYFVVGKNEK